MESPPSLSEIVADVERRRRVVTVFGPKPPGWLFGLLESRHVTIEHHYVASSDVTPFVTVYDGTDFLGTIRLSELEALVSPDPGLPGGTTHGEATAHRLRRMLADTVFSSLDRQQLLAATREIEDRAWRVGSGEIHAGFQSLSALRAQRKVYAGLADRQGLAVHVYGRPDWIPVEPLGITVHTSDRPEVSDYWYVVFDGGGDDDMKCALVAEQVDDLTYSGFWTYEPEIVDSLLARLDYLFAAESAADGTSTWVLDGIEGPADGGHADHGSRPDAPSGGGEGCPDASNGDHENETT